MDTPNTQRSEQNELPENETRVLPKLEDLATLTGLFSPSVIFEEFRELEKLDVQEQKKEQGETKL